VATIAEELTQIQKQKTRERIARRSDVLRKFVKEDLLAALQNDIKKGGSGYAKVQAPDDINFLFVGKLDFSDRETRYDSDSAYAPVWKEIEEWLEAEGLALRTGEVFDEGQRGGVPWSSRPWGGYLFIPQKKPEPVPTKPAPPPTQKVKQGADLSWNEVWGLIVTAMIIAAVMSHLITKG